jgi:hypothetical protein
LHEHESIIAAFEVSAEPGRKAGGEELDDVTPLLESPT